MPDGQLVNVYQIYPKHYLAHPVQSFDEVEVIDIKEIPEKNFTINIRYIEQLE